ncbi:MAG: secG [Deltaproteobacteria bacterium]|nr:secG [Deltaproteobacteria bacterium]
MLTIVAIIHVLVSVALIFIVLLQTGRGSEIGAAFGSGASQTLFGSSGTTGFMTKVTSAAVVIFMVTSLLQSSGIRGAATGRPEPAGGAYHGPAACP